VTGLVKSLPAPQVSDLATGIDAGRIKAIVSMGEDIVPALSAAQVARVSIVYVGARRNATSDAARIVFPGLTQFEKSGAYINQQFRLQKFEAAVPGPAGAADDRAILGAILAACGAPALPTDLPGLWRAIAAAIPALQNALYSSIPDAGLLLDRTPWAGLPFVEGESLHHKP